VEGLEGRVVLIDFWTYSCINCQRTFPYLTAWDELYRDQGLTIIGVHSPEFAFEKVVSNVEDAASRYGIDYPIAIDNDFATWEVWDQRFWPAHYLIDQEGVVRQVHYGEGGYAETERLIQELLDVNRDATVDADPGNHTQGRTQETYLGYGRLQHADNEDIVFGEQTALEGTTRPELDTFSFDGTWTIEEERAVATDNSRLYLHFYAADVYLVLEGEGTVTVSLASQPSERRMVTIDGVSDLYTLYEGAPTDDVMTLEFSSGVAAYAFTFG
jgi:thiol-disulfide isomerase/thioredoxin